MKVGEAYQINELNFGSGRNMFRAENPGDIFVTDLPSTSSAGKLNQIGVFGEKQNFAISFSEETAFNQNIRVKGAVPERGIYTIPENTTLKGTFIIQKLRD